MRSKKNVALGALSIQAARNLESMKRDLPDAYRGAVLLWELGMRAFRELDPPPYSGDDSGSGS